MAIRNCIEASDLGELISDVYDIRSAVACARNTAYTLVGDLLGTEHEEDAESLHRLLRHVVDLMQALANALDVAELRAHGVSATEDAANG
jgi:hypothetical protein